MFNHIGLMGRFTSDPEVKKTNSGVSVVSFTLAVDRDYVNKETNERGCDFIDCVAWRSTADFIGKYFCKGKQALVSGRLEIRKYTDKDGNKRTAAEVVVGNIYFGDSKSKAEPSNEPLPSTEEFFALDDDEGVPF